MLACNAFDRIRTRNLRFCRSYERYRWLSFAVVVIVFLASHSTLAHGQATVSSIVGTVTDSTGAGVPLVEVTVTNQATNAVRMAPTNA